MQFHSKFVKLSFDVYLCFGSVVFRPRYFYLLLFRVTVQSSNLTYVIYISRFVSI